MWAFPTPTMQAPTLPSLQRMQFSPTFQPAPILSSIPQAEDTDEGSDGVGKIRRAKRRKALEVRNCHNVNFATRYDGIFYYWNIFFFQMLNLILCSRF